MNIMNIKNYTWLGRLIICKPLSTEDVGIPVQPWEHLAIIDNCVFTYIWDTREITNTYPLSDLQPFVGDNIKDNHRALLITRNTKDRAAMVARDVLQKFPDLPIVDGVTQPAIKTLKAMVARNLLSIDLSKVQIADNCQSVFVPKDKPMANTYMFEETSCANDELRRYADPTPNIGYGKYYAILARIAIVNEYINETSTKPVKQ